jgi:hypothetical protein
MQALEQLLGLFVIAVLLAAAARRVGAPYPVFLALGGALIALLPSGPAFTLPPELALALFVAPVLLDSAYDMSLRDLRDNWAPVTGLVVFAVGLTTAAVAVLAHALVPALPWAAAVALGAIVAPPDAVAASAVLRQLHPPHRIVTILEGESLLNDATALLIYRLAVGAVACKDLPPFRRSGILPGRGRQPGRRAGARPPGRVRDGPRRPYSDLDHPAIRLYLRGMDPGRGHGLSAVLTMVCYAMTIKRSGPRQLSGTRAHCHQRRMVGGGVRPQHSGLHLHRPADPADSRRPGAGRTDPLPGVAGAVLVTVIAVRIAWHMSFNAVLRWRDRRYGFKPPRPMLRPTVGSGLVISWAGMRGIVTLAAAMALAGGFPATRPSRIRCLRCLARDAGHPGTHAQAPAAGAPPARRRSGRPRGRGGTENAPTGPGWRAWTRSSSPEGTTCARSSCPCWHAARGRMANRIGRLRANVPCTGKRCVLRAIRFTRCARTTRSATTHSIASSRSWTGSKWRSAMTRADSGGKPIHDPSS